MKGVVYVETSAILRILLEEERELLADLARARKLVTSALTRVEAERTLGRALRERRIDARQYREAALWLRRFLGACDITQLDAAILQRAAEEFPVEPVRTLDGLHLASALLWEDGIGATTVVSCDDRVRENARALGMKVHPV